jgi:hypothetical protein
LVGVAVNVTLPPAHTVVALALMLNEELTLGFTVMVMALDVAEAAVTQAKLEVITTCTISPFCRLDVVYDPNVLPMGLPFFNHDHVGVVPPFTGAGVKVTEVPAHIVVAEAVILTKGVTRLLTVMVRVLLVPVLEPQLFELVTVQVIWSPLTQLALV